MNYQPRIREMAHDQMVENLVSHLRSNGFRFIKAHLKGYDQPGSISWKKAKSYHIPDAEAWKGDVAYIFEIETADSLGGEHARSQRRLFSAYASERKKKFVLVVSESAKIKAERILENEGMKAELWWIE